MKIFCIKIYLCSSNKLIQKKLKLLQQRQSVTKPRKSWYQLGRSDQWWQDMINGISPDDWKKFFDLVDLLKTTIGPNPNTPNFRSLSAAKKLAITLYYLKDMGSLGMSANHFGVANCTASKVIFEVCSAICSVLGPSYLHLPRDQEDMKMKVAEFEAKFGIVQAFGATDGTHVPIMAPSTNSQDYYNYKSFHSLDVQAICDYRGLYLDVECRWPGSVHDAKMFTNSSINRKLQNSQLPKTYQCILPGMTHVPNYIICDPAYPPRPFCMKELDTCSNNGEVVFNNLLHSARNPVECALGRLKARWSILTRKMDLKLDNIPTVIFACFVLHNFCES